MSIPFQNFMHLKRQLISRTLICLALSAHYLFAEAAQPDQSEQAAVSQAVIVTKEMRAALQQFVSHYAGNAKNKPQHIYIASVKTESGENTVYAYWKEDQSILIMNFFTQVVEEDGLSWLHHKARIDLKTDVVATEAEMSGSNYLVTRAWAANIIKTCRERGRVLVFKAVHRRNK
ncbi:hypothetical protein ACO0LG_04935 [Undibacterium sp. Ji42W]|uniref:hypothetical protein n=1 Tax=Undibacterium sp. Ji42W TaxID=3413039 RepID=UPI003BF2C316